MIRRIMLSDGTSMPILGLGTWELTGRQCLNTVIEALAMGYSHIDTAEAYENHRDIRPALRGVERSELFITSKIPPGKLGYDEVLDTAEKILAELGSDYLDLLLIHWPDSSLDMRRTLEAFRTLVERGLIRSAGVSNFTQSHLERILEDCPVPIVVNQIEYHPYLNQTDVLAYCREHQCAVTAYCPLARGEVIKAPELKRIAQKHQVTAAQVALAWLMQKGLAVIPKAGSSVHLRENFESLSVELDEEDMKMIDGLNKNMRLVEPDLAEFDLNSVAGRTWAVGE